MQAPARVAQLQGCRGREGDSVEEATEAACNEVRLIPDQMSGWKGRRDNRDRMAATGDS